MFSPGAMYPTDPLGPAMLVELLNCVEASLERNFASPKSPRHATISSFRRTLLGFRSQ
jgi:hypothetical protein